PHGGNLAAANPHFEADRHVLKFRGVQTDLHTGQLPDSRSFFHWREQEVFGALKLTAVKQSEDGRDLIVRFYNALDRPVSASFALSAPILGAWRTNLNEEDQATLAVVEGAVP
ncbi:glycosyl hydrolase-related protein, partial [Arthrospira platensis SPKY2]